MKTRWFAQVPGLALAGMLMLLVPQVLAFGQDGSWHAPSLVGTWRLELTPHDCASGQPTGAPPNQALHTYLDSGSLVGSTNITAFRSPSYGIWKPTGQRHFLATFTNFRFNADGTPAGTAEVTERITLGKHADRFTATVVVRILDTDDEEIATACVGETAERLAFDQ